MYISVSEVTDAVSDWHQFHTLTSKQCTETKVRSFAHGLVYTLNPVKPVIIKAKSFHNFSVLLNLATKLILPDQIDFIKYWSKKRKIFWLRVFWFKHWTFSRIFFAPYYVRSSRLMASLKLPHVLYLSCKWHTFRKTIIWHEMCPFHFLHNFHLKFFSAPEETRKVLSQIYLCFLVRFQQSFTFSSKSSRITTQNFKLFNVDTGADRQTYRHNKDNSRLT